MTKFQFVSDKATKGTAMKAFVSLTAGVLLATAAGAASAQDPAQIQVGGQASAICTLPGAWQTRTSVGGSVGTFGGNTWTIPESSFANASGTPVLAGELALRITGQAFCNSSHRIRVESLKGGMQHEAMSEAPSGFSVFRQVKYDAHWANDSLSGQARRVGPGVFDWIPQGPTSAQEAVWAANATNGIPGSRYFDLRLSVRRSDGSANTPLVAGRYYDVVTVTLTPNG